MCTRLFIVVLLVLTKNLKKPKCPLIENSLNKHWYAHIMEYL